MKRTKKLAAVAGALTLGVTMAACGGDSDNGRGDSNSAEGGGGDQWTLGWAETITSMDPAGSYDLGSWNMQYSIYEQLVVIPPGETEPTGDAAESCTQDDPKTVTCKLREGLKFSNGNELTSSDVLYSFKRNIEIADPNGSSVLLGSISNGDEKNPSLADGAIETPDDTTVVFHLNAPDLTFMKVLTTATGSIVDEETFPADKLLGDADVVGSGPYSLSQWQEGEQATLEANKNYDGDRTGNAPLIFVKFFDDAGPLKTAIEQKSIDVAWRGLGPTDITSLEDTDGVEVLNGEGSEFRYWVWQFSTDAGKDKAVRQAAAQIIDRQTIADEAYQGTVTPAYSIVPPGFAGQKDSFKDVYGESPDLDAAKQTLEDAGVKTPVSITLGYTPTHYGPNAVDEANLLAEQLTESGLFKVKTEDAEWEEYQGLYKEGAYDLFILGWFPDFLDADNYLSPFLRDGGFYANNYKSDEANSLLDKEIGEADEATREKEFGELQDLTAEDVPLIPSWNGKNTAVATDKMSGVEDTLDATYIFRLWSVSKGD